MINSKNIERNEKEKKENEAQWIDYIKFICIILMIFIHGFVFSATIQDTTLQEGILSQLILAGAWLGWFPLLVPLLSGCSLYSFLTKKGEKGEKSIQLIFISIFLFIIGVLLNVSTWGKESLFAWDALHLIASSFLVIGLSYLFSKKTPILIGSIIFIITAIKPQLENIITIKPLLLQQILFGDPNGFSYWPIFPWMFTIFFGFFFMQIYSSRSTFFRVKVFIISIILCSISLFQGTLFPKLQMDNIWGSSLFMIGNTQILGLCGIFGFLFLIGREIEKYVKKKEKEQKEQYNDKKFFKISKFIKRTSNNILWIYAFHIFVGYKLSTIMNTSTLIEAIFFVILLFLITGIFSEILSIIINKRITIKLRRTN